MSHEGDVFVPFHLYGLAAPIHPHVLCLSSSSGRCPAAGTASTSLPLLLVSLISLPTSEFASASATARALANPSWHLWRGEKAGGHFGVAVEQQEHWSFGSVRARCSESTHLLSQTRFAWEVAVKVTVATGRGHH